MSEQWLVLTGATSRIGQLTAKRWRERGGRVLAISRRPDPESPHDELVTADLRTPRAVADTVSDWMASQNVVPVGLVYAAGTVFADQASHTTPDEWEQTLNVNLAGAFWLARAVAALMVEGGSLVMVSSIDARHVPRLGPDAAYGAAKAGLEGLVRHLAVEWGPRQIRVNAVAPGPMGQGMGVPRELAKSLAPSSATGHLASPEEVVWVIDFLLDSRSRAITGQCLAVDHGFGLAY